MYFVHYKTGAFCSYSIHSNIYNCNYKCRSDVLGQFMPMVGVDWSQNGVAHLFSAIKVCSKTEVLNFIPRYSSRQSQLIHYISSFLQLQKILQMPEELHMFVFLCEFLQQAGPKMFLIVLVLMAFHRKMDTTCFF